MTPQSQSGKPFDAMSITRPDGVLMTYYFLASLLAGPFFFIPLLPLFFKYETLRYRFDDSGISMRWGILFRREIHLTYRRIQDIHLTRNLIQRWMGLATVGIQTASGSAGPEMSIEGILEAEELRDFLYTKMRGARGLSDPAAAGPEGGATEGGGDADEALALLREIRDLLQERSGAGRAEP
jgi:putative membrane protein